MGVGSRGSPRLIRSVERPLSAKRNFRFGSVTAPSDWPRARVSRTVAYRPILDIAKWVSADVKVDRSVLQADQPKQQQAIDC